jgi:hypothetical protein
MDLNLRERDRDELAPGRLQRGNPENASVSEIGAPAHSSTFFTARENNLDIQIRFGMGAFHEWTTTTKRQNPRCSTAH